MSLPQADLVRYIGSNVTVVSADGATFTELIRVTIPPIDGWVELDGKITLMATTAGQQASFIAGLMPSTAINIFGLLDGGAANLVGAASGTNSEPEGRQGRYTALLPPDSPGEYVLGATRKSGSNAGVMVGTALIPSFLKWRRLT